MKSVWSIAVTALLAAALLSGTATAKDITVEKTFSGLEAVRIRTVLGGCSIFRSDDGNIRVKVVHDWDPEDFDVEMEASGRRLLLEEDIHSRHDSNNRRSHWTLYVPDGIDIRFNSATGSLEVEGLKLELEAESGTGEMNVTGCEGVFDLSSGTGDVEIAGSKGEFELSSGTGSVELEDCSGEFEASSGTGRVRVSEMRLEGESEFSSGTGSAYVELPVGTEYDLEISSGTGNATLDLMGSEPDGYFEFTALERHGRIICPVEPDGEEEYERNDDRYVRKYFRRGTSEARITISTGTGKARLKLK